LDILKELLFMLRWQPDLLMVLLGGLLVASVLLRLYRSEGKEGVGARTGLFSAWDFDPQKLCSSAYVGLALASLLGLYLELLMIRWISSEIRIFAYLKNFVLIACFFGFGLGCYLSRRRANLMALLVPLLALAMLVRAPWPGLANLLTNLQAFIGDLAEVETWGVPTLPRTWLAWENLLTTVGVALPLFAWVTFVFVPIGQIVGGHLESRCKGISGYTVNLLASLAGILLFTLLSFLSQPPWVWLAGAGVLLMLLFWRQPRLRWTAAAGMAAVVLVVTAVGVQKAYPVYWSPYQKLGFITFKEGGVVTSYAIKTNDNWYQQIYNLSPAYVAAHQEEFRNAPLEWNPYNIPYHFYPNPPSVLVLGAGTGNDVAAALRNGAGEVTAVEIDPLILRLGRRYHFEQPYSSPRVTAVNADARNYLQTADRQFDLILFSLLDSHTTNAYYSNIRIDNYVYTLEAMRAARRLLRPDGLMIVKYWVETPWIGGRLRELVETAFGQPPVQFEAAGQSSGTPGRFFVCGSSERLAAALENPALAAYVAKHSDFKTQPAQITTDDWPYFYQREPGLPTIVVLISIALLPLCWGLLRGLGNTEQSIEWHFFFLGAGFLLLETQIISKTALLFGTTWVVNAVVIAALLLLMVAANVTVERMPQISMATAYAGILVTSAGAYLTPLRALLFPSLAMRLLAAVALCLPVYFAGIVFIRSFAAAGFRSEALGSNLFGALVGGLLEAASFWFGMRSLLLLAGGLYLASWLVLSSRREQVLAAVPEVLTPVA
jgi:spermidine synthase